jgi:hypothetical protein
MAPRGSTDSFPRSGRMPMQAADHPFEKVLLVSSHFFAVEFRLISVICSSLFLFENVLLAAEGRMLVLRNQRRQCEIQVTFRRQPDLVFTRRRIYLDVTGSSSKRHIDHLWSR